MDERLPSWREEFDQLLRLRRGPAHERRLVLLRAMMSASEAGTLEVEVATPSVALFAVEAPAPKQAGEALPAAPAWVEVVPAPRDDADDGHVETRDWRTGFQIEDLQAFVDRFNDEPAHLRPKILDWEHATHSWRTERNPAAGWIEALEVRGEAIWGRIEWTPEGRDDVVHKRYRYISAVVSIRWPADTEGNIDFSAIPRGVELVDAALTNNPATYIRDLATTALEEVEAQDKGSDEEPLHIAASRQGGQARAHTNDPHDPPKTSTDDTMELSIAALTALGLSADAGPAEIEAAILARQDGASPAAPPSPSSDPLEPLEPLEIEARLSSFEASLVERDARIASLEAEKAKNDGEIAKTRVEVVLSEAAASSKFAPAEREGLLEYGMSMGPEKLTKLLSNRPSLAHLKEQLAPGAAGESKAPKLSVEDREIIEQLGLEEEAFLKSREVLSSRGGRFSPQLTSLVPTTNDSDDDAAA